MQRKFLFQTEQEVNVGQIYQAKMLFSFLLKTCKFTINTKMVLVVHQHYLYTSLRTFIFVNFHCKGKSIWFFFRFAVLDL